MAQVQHEQVEEEEQELFEDTGLVTVQELENHGIKAPDIKKLQVKLCIYLATFFRIPIFGLWRLTNMACTLLPR